MVWQLPRASSGDARPRPAASCAAPCQAVPGHAYRDVLLNSCQVALGAEERPSVMFLCSPFDVLKRHPLPIKLPLASELIFLAAAVWLPVCSSFFVRVRICERT